MRGNLKILAFFLLVLLSQGCNREYDPYYLKDETVSITVDSKTLFSFDEMTCQMSYNQSECKFAAFKDDMSSYYILVLGSAPSGERQSIGNCSVRYTTSNDVVSLDGLTFSVEKLDASSGKLWLWCKEKSIFIVAGML